MRIKALPGALWRGLPFFGFFVVGLVLLSLSRLSLSLWQGAAVSAVEGWGAVLLQGVRVDVASLCLLGGLVCCLYLLLPNRWVRLRAVQWTIGGWLVLGLALLLTLELATPAFMSEYGLRPNRLFLEYLIYPREVMATLAKGHTLSSVLALLLTALAVAGLCKLARPLMRLSAAHDAPWLSRGLLAVAVLLLSVLGVCSTLGHRPMNPAMLAFSSNATVNVLPLNSFYSLAFAARELLRSDEGARIYGQAGQAELVAAMRAQVAASGARLLPGEPVLQAVRAPVYTGKPRNLVIILEESLGAQFVGALGGRPLTPHLDRLYTQGWGFDRLYATGTRSVRGIEAVLTGFTPTPSQAVVKQPLAQQGFFTLAQLLGRQGYRTTFHYGGESHFDNMRGFFLGNGFERVIERKDYPSPAFVGSWGVSDEDLLQGAHRSFVASHASGQPFFGFVFTSSNHDPFEFPDGAIALYEQPKATRNNAAKYADHALGQFFAAARQADYWDDTVFLVIADHDSRAFGRDLVPVENFHIPGVILGAGITPYRDGRIASQIDMAPTLLSLLGVDAPTPLLGHDLTDRSAFSPGRALMQYDRNFALMKGDALVVLQPEKPAGYFRYQPGQALQPMSKADPALGREALLNALWGTVAYEKGWHRMVASPGRG